MPTEHAKTTHNCIRAQRAAVLEADFDGRTTLEIISEFFGTDCVLQCNPEGRYATRSASFLAPYVMTTILTSLCRVSAEAIAGPSRRLARCSSTTCHMSASRCGNASMTGGGAIYTSGVASSRTTSATP
jgi:hypothetical protein